MARYVPLLPISYASYIDSQLIPTMESQDTNEAIAGADGCHGLDICEDLL